MFGCLNLFDVVHVLGNALLCLLIGLLFQFLEASATLFVFHCGVELLSFRCSPVSSLGCSVFCLLNCDWFV